MKLSEDLIRALQLAQHAYCKQLKNIHGHQSNYSAVSHLIDAFGSSIDALLSENTNQDDKQNDLTRNVLIKIENVLKNWIALDGALKIHAEIDLTIVTKKMKIKGLILEIQALFNQFYSPNHSIAKEIVNVYRQLNLAAQCIDDIATEFLEKIPPVMQQALAEELGPAIKRKKVNDTVSAIKQNLTDMQISADKLKDVSEECLPEEVTVAGIAAFRQLLPTMGAVLRTPSKEVSLEVKLDALNDKQPLLPIAELASAESKSDLSEDNHKYFDMISALSSQYTLQLNTVETLGQNVTQLNNRQVYGFFSGISICLASSYCCYTTYAATALFTLTFPLSVMIVTGVTTAGYLLYTANSISQNQAKEEEAKKDLVKTKSEINTRLDEEFTMIVARLKNKGLSTETLRWLDDLADRLKNLHSSVSLESRKVLYDRCKAGLVKFENESIANKPADDSQIKTLVENMRAVVLAAIHQITNRSQQKPCFFTNNFNEVRLLADFIHNSTPERLRPAIPL